MAIFSFGQKNNTPADGGQSDEAEKKIEFAQKLPPSEIEGKERPRGGDFDFLKKIESRNPGESAPVKIAAEPEAEEREAAPEEPLPEKPKRPNWLSVFFKAGAELSGKKDRSRVLEVNLVKGEVVKFFDWQKGILIILVAIFSTTAFTSGIYWGISLWGANRQGSQNGDYLQQYYKISKQINDLNPQVNEILAFKTKLDQVNFLMERHIYWTNFFSFLEDNTLSNVYFSGFSGSVNGSYSLSATTDNLNAIDAQIKRLLVNKYIKNAAVDSGAVGSNNGKPVVSFSLSFILDPKIFLQ
jgi:hypothetical protein